jgi:hypothetical protein
MPELNRSGIPYKFNQYSGHNRYMESLNNKYFNSWNIDLYLYSYSRAVCHYSNNEYCCNSFDYPHICTDRTSVSEQHSSGIARKFNKYSGHNRYMEPGYY